MDRFYNITAKVIAELLGEHPGEPINFTYDDAENLRTVGPCGWYGIKYIRDFCCTHGTVIGGYYGGDVHFAMPVDPEGEGVTLEYAVVECIETLDDQDLFKHRKTVCTDWGR